MPPELVCIGNTYADGKYMRMYGLCRCLAYGYASPIRTSLFFRTDPKKGKVGSGLAKHEEGRRRYDRKESKAKGRGGIECPL